MCLWRELLPEIHPLQKVVDLASKPLLSLISLVVSVDVKHHVYLLNARLDLPTSPIPVSHAGGYRIYVEPLIFNRCPRILPTPTPSVG